MLGGLLKSGWQSSSAEKRRLAILKMNADDVNNQTIFEKLAVRDPDQSVRQACISQLSAPASLFKVYQSQVDDQTMGLAKSAFCSSISNNSQLSETDFEALVAEYKGASMLVAQYCPHDSVRTRLIDEMTQIQQAEAIADVHYARTRQHIADQIDQIEALEIARRNLKGKDKKAEKLIRTKLEKYRSQQKLEREVNESALSLCEQMEFIANHPQWRSEFKGKFDQYILRWSSLELKPEATLGERFNAAKQAADSKVSLQIKQEDAVQKQSTLSHQLELYCQKLAPLPLSELSDERLSINTVLSDALATWLENTQIVAPAPALVTKFQLAQQALSSLSDLIESTSSDDINLKALASKLSKLDWHSSYTELSAKTEATDLLSQLKSQHSQQAKQNKDNLDSLHKRINRLLGTSNKGDVKKAKHELSATSKAASHYSGKERKILDDRLQMASEIVSKMSDWQSFATEPKLIELCESMEKLANSQNGSSKTHPDKLAQEISKLQSQWKKLGHTDVSDEYWLRFKASADIAYEPCAIFFEQRRASQKANLAKREPLVAQMQALLDNTDWDNAPDYKKVELALRDINNDWRKIKDVERKAGQKQWDKLSAIRNAVYEKLDIVYDTNIELKKQIIAQVNTLTDGTVNDNSLEKLKLFQSRWKQVGVTRRKQDQEAWTAFRAAGDALFEKVKGLRDQKRAAEDRQIEAYQDIIKQIHSLAKSATNLADADAEFNQLSERYASLPPLPKELPEKRVERLESDFKRASDAYSKTHDRIIQASKDEVIDRLRAKATLCGRLELAYSRDQVDDIADIEQALKEIVITDKVLEKRFQTRLKEAKNANRADFNQTRIRLCIDLEILLDVASPEHDKALRMQVQLERMKTAGIGQNPNQQVTTISELRLDWLCLPGAEPKLQASLEARFNQLIAKA